MIKKTTAGYKVTSEKGKTMSRPDLTKTEAEKRIAQIEYFKANPKKPKK